MEENLDEILEESNDKNKFSKDKKSIAIIILTALLIIIFIGLSQINAETFTKLSSVLTSKDEIIQENQKQIEDLKDEKNTLIQENQNLESEKHQLQCEKHNLEVQKNTLEQENKKLNDQIEQLKKLASNRSGNSNTTNSSSNTQKPIATQNTNSTIVYVTKTGEKYHRGSCSYLWNSKIEINLSYAKSLGYTPCSRCF